MSQGDYFIANASGAVVRADINDQLEAIATLNSGTSEPSVKFANMWWFDTTNNLLKIRNAANTAWIIVAEKNGNNWTPYRLGVALGTASVAALGTSGNTVPKNDTANVFSATQKIESTDGGAGEGPADELSRKSGTPAASDIAGVRRFKANNSALVETTMVKYGMQIIDPLSGDEDAFWFIDAIAAGVLARRWNFWEGMWDPSASGGNQGPGSVNVSDGYYVNGVQIGASQGPELIEGPYTLSGSSFALQDPGIVGLNAWRIYIEGFSSSNTTGWHFFLRFYDGGVLKTDSNYFHRGSIAGPNADNNSKFELTGNITTGGGRGHGWIDCWLNSNGELKISARIALTGGANGLFIDTYGRYTSAITSLDGFSIGVNNGSFDEGTVTIYALPQLVHS